MLKNTSDVLHLIKTFCLPVLTYGSECLNYSSSYYVAIRTLCPKKHVITFSTVTLTIGVRLQ